MDKELWAKFTQKQYNAVLNVLADKIRNAQVLDDIHLTGLCLLGLGRIQEGMDWTCASLALSSPSVEWYTNGATACMEQEQYLHALLFLKNGLEAYPNDIKMTYMQGLCHVNIHEWAMGVASFEKALSMDSSFYPPKLGIGFCYHMLSMYDKALETYTTIIESSVLPPDSDDAEVVHNNYACVLMEQAKQQEALNYLIKNCPGTERPATLYNMAFLYMGLSVWPLGWELYKYRETIVVSKDRLFRGDPASSVPKVEQPLANSLHEIHDKHLLFFHEQGFGDSIQFMRFAKILEPIASKITLAVPKALYRLAQNMRLEKPFDVIFDNSDAVACDIALPMLDAPALFGLTRETIPDPGPYLRVPSDMRKQYWLGSTGEGLRVGICWAGAARVHNLRAHSIDRRRSIPFEDIEPLLYIENVDFFSLQLSEHHKEHPHLSRILEDDFDMLDTAAFVSQMDLVITIDSVIAHLAGALGIPVWLLSRFDGCWRWFWEGEITTPWYSTMRIFRQPAHNTWPDVIAKVGKELVLYEETVL